ncbi:CLUMA_CG004670, isoform A [Clunio marinus]|uniref:CLUMA_CG004670, isoform A n=1 Tax=Clunio marinus TaxID=568069 RepID=A0A1J1HSK3_9DIPT|nr:CLUMA_CG004670, isoform A [Clunio marinus]
MLKKTKLQRENIISALNKKYLSWHSLRPFVTFALMTTSFVVFFCVAAQLTTNGFQMKLR